jgi:hypothetical protein
MPYYIALIIPFIDHPFVATILAVTCKYEALKLDENVKLVVVPKLEPVVSIYLIVEPLHIVLNVPALKLEPLYAE